MGLSGNLCHRVQWTFQLQLDHGPRHDLRQQLDTLVLSGSVAPGHQGHRMQHRFHVAFGDCGVMGINIDLSCSKTMATDMVLSSSLGLDVTIAQVTAKATQWQHGS